MPAKNTEDTQKLYKRYIKEKTKNHAASFQQTGASCRIHSTASTGRRDTGEHGVTAVSPYSCSARVLCRQPSTTARVLQASSASSSSSLSAGSLHHPSAQAHPSSPCHSVLPCHSSSNTGILPPGAQVTTNRAANICKDLHHL